jgi:hypothetical protein
MTSQRLALDFSFEFQFRFLVDSISLGHGVCFASALAKSPRVICTEIRSILAASG